MSPHGVVLVRVPVPERYAIHKLLVSQLRTETRNKFAKDLSQAAILIEALVENFPGAVEEALAAVPKSAVRHLRRAVTGLSRYLPAGAALARDVLKLPAKQGAQTD